MSINDFRETYSRMTYDQLLHLAREVDQLVPEAKIALDAELAKRKAESEEMAGNSENPLNAAAGSEARNLRRSGQRRGFGLFLMASTAFASRSSHQFGSFAEAMGYVGAQLTFFLIGAWLFWFKPKASAAQGIDGPDLIANSPNRRPRFDNQNFSRTSFVQKLSMAIRSLRQAAVNPLGQRSGSATLKTRLIVFLAGCSLLVMWVFPQVETTYRGWSNEENRWVRVHTSYAHEFVTNVDFGEIPYHPSSWKDELFRAARAQTGYVRPEMNRKQGIKWSTQLLQTLIVMGLSSGLLWVTKTN